jgi:hypothetical protein
MGAGSFSAGGVCEQFPKQAPKKEAAVLREIRENYNISAILENCGEAEAARLELGGSCEGMKENLLFKNAKAANATSSAKPRGLLSAGFAARHTGTKAHRHMGTWAHRHTGTQAHRHMGAARGKTPSKMNTTAPRRAATDPGQVWRAAAKGARGLAALLQ